MAEAPETIDIFSARPWDIVIYGGYSSSEALRDTCFVGIYQGFEYWTPDERPLERANEHGQTPIGPGTPPTAICPRPGQKEVHRCAL
jgi:hypothetical protein